MFAHQRIRTSSSRHVVCHWQRRSEVLLDEEVEDLIWMRGSTAEDALAKRFGRSQSLKGLWVRVADDVEHLRLDGRHLVLCRSSEEGRECGEIRDFIPFRESIDRWTVSAGI